MTLTISPALVFGVYVAASQGNGEILDASKLFTSLILVSLLASPLIKILQIIPMFGAAKGCFTRLQKFLEKQERIDGRLDFMGQAISNDSGEMNPQSLSEENENMGSSGANIVISIKDA